MSNWWKFWERPEGIKVLEIEATKLEPNSKYLIVVDSSAITIEDAQNLQDVLRKREKVSVTVLIVRGDPNKTTKMYALPKDTSSQGEE